MNREPQSSSDSNMMLNRRELLKFGASHFAFVVGSQLFFGAQVSAAVRESFLSSSAAGTLRKLPKFDGFFYVDPAKLVPFASDFGRSVPVDQSVPMGVLQAASSSDILKIVRYCAIKNIKLTARGTGGAAYGQTLVGGGIVIDTHASLKQIRWFDEKQGLVELAPGLEWGEVLNFTKALNRSPYVLPDTVVTSVGGKINVGGIGETSYNQGAITDHVVEFDLITADGKVRLCRPDNRHHRLFHAALGSMGQLGIVSRVVIKTFEMPKTVYTWQFVYPKDAQLKYITTVLHDLQVIANSEPAGAIGGHFVGKQGFNFVLDVTSTSANPAWLKQVSQAPASPTPKEWSFFDYATRNTAGWQSAIASGFLNTPHPYLGCFVPAAKTEELINYVMNTDLANRTTFKIFVMPLLTQNFSKENSFVLPSDPLVYHVRLYRNVTSGILGEEHKQVLEFQHDTLVPKILGFGGKVYLPFSSLLDEAQLETQLGHAKWAELKKLKKKADPKHLLNSGAGFFA